MKIQEVIVVEGKNDSLRLKSFFDCDTIITSGLGIKKETIEYIREVNETRGIILLLDPDVPGEKIRKVINEAIPNLKNAFLLKKDARTSKKVGVEHASYEVLKEALDNFITYSDGNNSITNSDMYTLGLVENKARRQRVCAHYHLGECNVKTLRKRLNMLDVKYSDIKELLDE